MNGTSTPAATTPRPESHARNWRGTGLGFVVKLLLMGVVNAFGISVILSAWSAQSWVILGASVVLLAVANWVYFARRTVPLKYLLPGLVFLFVFQIFTLGYTGYVAFTNYGTGHAGSMQQAVDAALIQDERRLPGAADYPLAVVTQGDTVGFAINDDGVVKVGTSEQALAITEGATVSDAGLPVEVPGWTVVPRAELLTNTEMANTVTSMRVPVSAEASDGSVRTREGSKASIYSSRLTWDEQAQTLTNSETGTVYSATDRGNFVGDDGSTLPAGWYVNVGFDNFVRAVSDTSLAGPLLQVSWWTFAFALGSVVISFGVGLGFALIYNDERVKGRKLIRTLLILPYAFPAFMSALLWRGMLNPEFGIVNDLFFGGASIGWLQDPWLARGAVLFVNVWLSYPYWFLVCTGALQALPADTLEAATLDGAGKWRRFQSVVLPLLLVSTAPLAISSFAFSFNNFTIIYMLSEGGPFFAGNQARLGATDILISAIYKISGVSGGVADYGLASALSIVVFVIIGVISAVAFRQTRKLEEYQ
ncbi:MAG: ABC transporter permease subunit [Propionibacteriaceae bacterium]|nr:ABC transporter permease subunit [Propionibacteriaceae bacterium]